MRFLPVRHVASTRVRQNLSFIQRAALDALAETGEASLNEILGAVRLRLEVKTPERTLQDNLRLLRQLGLVELSGKGRGARWAIRGGLLVGIPSTSGSIGK